MKKEGRLWRLFTELEAEITHLEEENHLLKERVKQVEERKIPQASPAVRQIDWIELESGKRFLTKKELGKYLGISAGTISNRLSQGTFPIRHKRIDRRIRFDMREVLAYLETNQPFWDRDRESKVK